MSKARSAAFETHLAQNVTTLCVCWLVKREDGTLFRFTTLDQDVVIEASDVGNPASSDPDFDLIGTYESAAGFDRSSITSDITLGVDNLDITGILDSDHITEADIIAGLFDHAEVRIFLVNYSDVTQGVLKLQRGRIGEVSTNPQGIFFCELRGLTQQMSQNMLEVYSPECRANLGDSRCGIPIKPDILDITDTVAVSLGEFYRVATTAGTGSFVYEDRIFEVTDAGTLSGTALASSYDVSVGVAVTDGTAQLTARDAFSRACQVVSVTDKKTFVVSELTPNSGGSIVGRDYFPDDAMNGGAVTFESGDNSGVTMEVKDFAADDGVTIEQTVTLHLPMPFDITVGDVLRIYRGCDRRSATCSGIFDNILNFRGEPFVPGTAVLTRIPNAK